MLLNIKVSPFDPIAPQVVAAWVLDDGVHDSEQFFRDVNFDYFRMSCRVTADVGFVESNFVLDWLARSDEPVLNLDKLTYEGNLENLPSLQGDARHMFVRSDLGDRALVDLLLAEHRSRAGVRVAVETHVDRSIHGLEDFIQKNNLAPSGFLKSCGPTGHGHRKSRKPASCTSAARAKRRLP